MMFSVASPAFSKLTEEIEGELAGAATSAMKEATRETVLELREQVTAAGLGVRLANTWRDRTYPLGRKSLTPAGYIWSNAPDIIDSFSRGATIVPMNGRRFLAIPTKNVPHAGGRRGATRLMTPEQVETAFNQDLFFKRGRGGRVLAFVNVLSARSGKGFRRGTKARLAQGRQLKPVLMFVLVPTTRLPKVLDLDGAAERGAARFEQRFIERL